MMHRVKVVCLALMAVFALGVVAAASASAAELPEFKTETKGTLSGGSGELTSKAGAIKCEKLTGTFEPLSTKSKTLGTYTLNFTTCKEPKLTLACKSLGDPYNSASKPENGTILTGGEWHLVPGPKQVPTALILLLVKELHVECSNAGLTITVLFLIKGDVLGLITPLGTKTKEFKVEVKTTKAEGTEQEEKTFENDSGTVVSAKLESSLDSGTIEPAGENSSAATLTMETETEIEK